jgi:hypothetical protein
MACSGTALLFFTFFYLYTFRRLLLLYFYAVSFLFILFLPPPKSCRLGDRLVCLVVKPDVLFGKICAHECPLSVLSNNEYTIHRSNDVDINFWYEFCDGNARAAFKKYRRRFPSRRHPSRVIFCCLHQRLRGMGTPRRDRDVRQRDHDQEHITVSNPKHPLSDCVGPTAN